MFHSTGSVMPEQGIVAACGADCVARALLPARLLALHASGQECPLHTSLTLDAETTGGVVLRRNFAYHLSLPSYPTSTAPPFTLKISPVMKLAYSVHRKSTGPAISSGVPTRPNGISRRISSPLLGLSSAGLDKSVSTQPGATELT